jgi:hypothetical protein
MLDVTVELGDGSSSVVANLRHRPDLRYPLMKVVRVRGSERRSRARSTARPTARSRRPRRRPSN